jgi:hypothetical protein
VDLNYKLFSERKEEPIHVKSSPNAHPMELGGVIRDRREEERDGAVIV